MAMSFTIIAEESLDLDEDLPALAWLREHATFEHREECEFVVHIGTDASECEEGLYYKERLASMKEAGATELAEIYERAMRAGAARLIVYPD